VNFLKENSVDFQSLNKQVLCLDTLTEKSTCNSQSKKKIKSTEPCMKVEKRVSQREPGCVEWTLYIIYNNFKRWNLWTRRFVTYSATPVRDVWVGEQRLTCGRNLKLRLPSSNHARIPQIRHRTFLTHRFGQDSVSCGGDFNVSYLPTRYVL
jgi:hypothetical protein